jgi:hypothetical protein
MIKGDLMKGKKQTIIIVILAILLGIFVFFLFNLLVGKDKLSSKKRVGDLIITESKLEHNGTIYILTGKVKNNSSKDLESVKLKITLYDKLGNEVTHTIGYLGDVKSKKTVELSAAFGIKKTDIQNVKYEEEK